MDSAFQPFFTFIFPAFRVLTDTEEGPGIVCELCNQMVTMMMAWDKRRNCYVSTSALFCMMLHKVIREMGEASLTAIQRGFTTPNNSFLYSLESR